MALRISRRGYLAGRPPGLGRGTSRSISFHWASVTSLGYGFLLMPGKITRPGCGSYPFLTTL